MQNYFDNEATSLALHATMKPARGGKCLVTLSTYEDRKEALLNTTIMDDAGTYRSKGAQLKDTLDNRESKQDTRNHIPKPPPLQMLSNQNKQTTFSVNNTNKAFAVNDQHLSINSQNLNASNSNDACNRPNKTLANTNGINTNRQTLRLGSVTIGEYRQQILRREPEKFNFISTQKKGVDFNGTTPTNEALQNELQNTLSRANLRKSNGNSYNEHQSNCPLHQQQQQQQLQQRQSVNCNGNGYILEEISKKLQKSSLNESNTTVNNTNRSAGMGILKNGTRNGTSSSTKSAEKSIKFG